MQAWDIAEKLCHNSTPMLKTGQTWPPAEDKLQQTIEECMILGYDFNYR